MDADYLAYLTKAIESLTGAESEFTNGRYNNCANRCYYAMFQAAVAALIVAGIQPAGERGQWEHDFVQARFSGVLVHRRKLYPADLAPLLPQIFDIRRIADYTVSATSRKVAQHALQKARVLVSAVEVKLR